MAGKVSEVVMEYHFRSPCTDHSSKGGKVPVGPSRRGRGMALNLGIPSEGKNRKDGNNKTCCYDSMYTRI